MRKVLPAAVLLISCGLMIASARHAPDSGISVTVYDSNPSHLWNRLYAALLVREDRNGHRYGEDSLDPFLWLETEHLLSQPSHQRALSVLDEFLGQHGEDRVRDPLKRAMLQRDLWAVFDWSVFERSANGQPTYEKEKRELQARLADVLRRLALTAGEIKSLSDYKQAVASGSFAKAYDPEHPDRPFLPPDLFDPHGPWVAITPSPELGELGVVAKMHTFNLSGRSSFLVFVNLPGGHKATLDYLQSLWNFPQPYVGGPSGASDESQVNPNLPSFPARTQVALVRRMNLFDNQGNLTTSSMIESVQIRVYHSVTNAEERNFAGGIEHMIKNSGQDFYEFRLTRPLLFSGKNGGLRAVGPDEKELSTFQTKGYDPIEHPFGDPRSESNAIPIVKSCAWCHSGGGIRSLNSREALLRPSRMQMEPPDPDYGPIYWGDSLATDWKQNRFDWGLLNGYWKSTPTAP
jgi:hypothetical protein